jgi:hypothetical protein
MKGQISRITFKLWYLKQCVINKRTDTNYGTQQRVRSRFTQK